LSLSFGCVWCREQTVCVCSHAQDAQIDCRNRLICLQTRGYQSAYNRPPPKKAFSPLERSQTNLIAREGLG
jgi:hypothetical protein